MTKLVICMEDFPLCRTAEQEHSGFLDQHRLPQIRNALHGGVQCVRVAEEHDFLFGSGNSGVQEIAYHHALHLLGYGHQDGVVFAALRLVDRDSVGRTHVDKSAGVIPRGTASIRQSYRVVGCFVRLGADLQNTDISVAAPPFTVIFGDHDPVAVPENGAFLQLEGVLVLKGRVHQRLDHSVQALDRQISGSVKGRENLDVLSGQIPLCRFIANSGLDILFLQLYQLEAVVKDQIGSTGESGKPSGVVDETGRVLGLTMGRFQRNIGDAQ